MLTTFGKIQSSLFKRDSENFAIIYSLKNFRKLYILIFQLSLVHEKKLGKQPSKEEEKMNEVSFMSILPLLCEWL